MTSDKPTQDVDNKGTVNAGEPQAPDIVGPTGEESPDATHDEVGRTRERRPPATTRRQPRFRRQACAG
jgi:hypothetical protein